MSRAAAGAAGRNPDRSRGRLRCAGPGSLYAVASGAGAAIADTVDPSSDAVEATVNPVAAMIETAIHPVAAPIQSTVDPVPATLDAIRGPVVPGCVESIRYAVVMALDSISTTIHMPIRPVTASVEAAIDAVTAMIEPSLQAIATIASAIGLGGQCRLSCRYTDDTDAGCERQQQLAADPIRSIVRMAVHGVLPGRCISVTKLITHRGGLRLTA